MKKHTWGDVNGQAVYRLLQTCQEACARLRRSRICSRSPRPKASTFAAAAELAVMLGHPRFARPVHGSVLPQQVTNILNWEPPLGEKGVEDP